MELRVNLVATLLIMGCLTRALENSIARRDRLDGKKNHVIVKKILKDPRDKVSAQNALSFQENILDHRNRSKGNRKQLETITALAKLDAEERDRPRRRKRRMDKTMMALLLAYKMKFIALVPTMMGGLLLLMSTALLAGFFFALFAAVLGLKSH